MHNSDPPRNGQSASESDVLVDELTCQQVVELVTEYFEGALQAPALSQVEEHLVMCDWCVTYAEQMQATLVTLRDLEDRAPPEPSDSVLAALRAKQGA